MKRQLVWFCELTALAFAALASFADEPPCATGFRQPAFVPRVRRLGPAAKSRALLRSGGEDLPAKWDSREEGWVSSVKNQGNIGACWAFATFAVLETQLLKAGRGEYDLSEKNMVSLSGFDLTPDDGGDYYMSAAYLLRWGGAVAESNDVYKSSIGDWTASPMLAPEVHVQNVVWTPQFGTSDSEVQELKCAIANYGAAAVSIGWSSSYQWTNTYYNSYSSRNNHAVAVVGWDDDFPASAFRKTAPGNGAWLIKNSWGKSGVGKGFFWVSYHDKSFSRGSNPTVFVPAADDEDYDVVRGYDRCGPVYDVTDAYYYTDDPQDADPLVAYDLQAAVFTSTWNEELAAVGLYSSVYPSPYTISVYTNVVKGALSPVKGGVLACEQSGTLDHAGFTTVHLHAPLPLADTNSFAVVYRQTGVHRTTFVSCTYVGFCHPENHPGNCYVGYVTQAGDVWRDAYYESSYVDSTDEGWAVCIKAYTRFAKDAPKGDAPAVDDDGTRMMSDVAANYPQWSAETSGTFGSIANFVGANERSLWASWLLGLDPADADVRDVALSIDLSSGSPRISWHPGLPDRTYTLYGCDALAPSASWYPVSTNELDATSARFFRLSVGQ